MVNKKITFSILFILLFNIIYLLLASRPLGKEYHYEPEWETNILNNTDIPSVKSTYYFKLANKAGYFDVDGNITKLINIPENNKISISETFYAPYPLNAENTEFFDKFGNSKGFIKDAGFPFFVKDKIFLFLPDGSSFSRLNNIGNPLWTYSGVMPITAFAAKDTSTAVGFADGTIKVFDTLSGKLKLQYAPGGSDNPVILGIDITEDGEYIASLSGQDRQRFVLAHKENTQVKIIHHQFMSENYAHQSIVHFTNDEKSVFYNYKNGIGIFNLENEKTSKIPISSRIIKVEESENMVILLGKKDNLFTVYLVEKSNSLSGKFSFKAESAFIRADENNLYVGKDNSLSKINITKK